MINKKLKTIYAIYCRPTKRTYIGCCSDFTSRARQHMNDLENEKKTRWIGSSKNRKHIPTQWQIDFNEHGRDAFEVYILESDVPTEIAIEREREFILKYRANEESYGYNNKLVSRIIPFLVKDGAPPLPVNDFIKIIDEVTA